MDRVVPSSYPANQLQSDDKYRKKLAAEFKELPQKGKQTTKQAATYSEKQILDLVNEVNAYFTSFGQYLLVLIEKNNDLLTLRIINSKTQELVKHLTIEELEEVARNLRNHKLTLVERDV